MATMLVVKHSLIGGIIIDILEYFRVSSLI